MRCLRLLTLLALVGLAASMHRMPPVEAHSGGHLFIHDSGTPNVLREYLVSSGGTLTAGSGSPVDTLNTNSGCGGDCQTMAYSARRKLLFTGGGSGISVVDISGVTPKVVAGSPFGGVGVIGVVAVEKGRNTFVYGADYLGNQIRGYRLTPTKTLETLTGSPFAAGQLPVGMSAARDLVFAANQTGKSISAYKAAADGRLTPAPGSPFVLPGDSEICNVDLDPQGRFLYVGDSSKPRVFGFSITARNAALRSLTGSPFATQKTSEVAQGISFVSPALLFAISGGDVENNIQAFRKSGRGTLAPLGAGQNSVDPIFTSAVDPSGRFLAVATPVNSVRLFSINKRSGAVVPATNTAAIMGAPTAMVFVKK